MKIKKWLIVGVAIIGLSAACEKDVTFSDLPGNLQNYITTHFPGATVTWAHKDGTDYEVTLSEGTSLKFERGAVREVNNYNGLTNSVIDPSAILSYVEAHAADLEYGAMNPIVEWERDPREILDYEPAERSITLKSGMGLYFTDDGTFKYQHYDD